MLQCNDGYEIFTNCQPFENRSHIISLLLFHFRQNLSLYSLKRNIFFRPKEYLLALTRGSSGSVITTYAAWTYGCLSISCGRKCDVSALLTREKDSRVNYCLRRHHCKKSSDTLCHSVWIITF